MALKAISFLVFTFLASDLRKKSAMAQPGINGLNTVFNASFKHKFN